MTRNTLARYAKMARLTVLSYSSYSSWRPRSSTDCVGERGLADVAGKEDRLMGRVRDEELAEFQQCFGEKGPSVDTLRRRTGRTGLLAHAAVVAWPDG